MLEELLLKHQVSPGGVAWLKLALDPWHDTSVDGFSGFPDEGIGKSVCFSVTQEYSIGKLRAPTPLPAGNWSCRIGNFPILTRELVARGFMTEEVFNQPTSTGYNLMPVQVDYAQDGADFASVGDASLYPANAQGCTLPEEYTQGTVTVCGMGIEVVNTTADLQKQGLMTCARMVQPDFEPFQAYFAMPAGVWATRSVAPVRALPKNLSEMALYPGFAQDSAKDGYYAPVQLKMGRHFNFPSPISTAVMESDPTSGSTVGVAPIPCHTSRLTVITVDTVNFAIGRNFQIYVPCDSNCVMFTGLSDATTLTLRVRWILERKPSDNEKQMLVIATPSATYDPVALEIYSRVVSRMPAGVPFTENPAGEWWAKMLGELATVLGPMVAMIPHPIAKAIGAGATVGGAALQQYAGTKSAARKSKNAAGKYGEGKKKNKQGQIVPQGAKKIQNVKTPKSITK